MQVDLHTVAIEVLADHSFVNVDSFHVDLAFFFLKVSRLGNSFIQISGDRLPNGNKLAGLSSFHLGKEVTEGYNELIVIGLVKFQEFLQPRTPLPHVCFPSGLALSLTHDFGDVGLGCGAYVLREIFAALIPSLFVLVLLGRSRCIFQLSLGAWSCAAFLGPFN